MTTAQQAIAQANTEIVVAHFEGDPYGNDFIVRDFRLGIRLASFYAGPDAVAFANAKRQERVAEILAAQEVSV